MQRDTKRLSTEVFDVVVIGAGVHGACVARDAALRGLRVALVERSDLCGETSHNSLKTIHGGIRYIQHLNFTRTREAIREQTIWLKTAPHLVRPLRFVMPTYGHGLRGPAAMFAGIQLYRLLGLGRNQGVNDQSRIQPGKVLGRTALCEMVDDIPDDGVSGAAIWWDAQVRFADRAIFEILSEAATHGAVVANYMEATGVLSEKGRAVGLALYDRLSEKKSEVSAKLIVNATGPWASDLADDLGQSQVRPTLTCSMNIVTKKPAREFALAIKSEQASDSKLGRTKRLFFEVPWEGCSIFGTTHGPADRDNDTPQMRNADMKQFLIELNAAAPALDLSMEDILYCYRGFTPSEDGEARSHESRIFDHGEMGGIAGMISIIGVKWTTGRLVAERAVNLACVKLGHDRPCLTRGTPLKPIEGLSYEIAGKPTEEIAATCRAHMEQTQTVFLRDMLFRRCNDLVCGRLGETEILAVAKTMRSHLSWDEKTFARQIEKVRESWLPPETEKIFTMDTLFERLL